MKNPLTFPIAKIQWFAGGAAFEQTMSGSVRVYDPDEEYDQSVPDFAPYPSPMKLIVKRSDSEPYSLDTVRARAAFQDFARLGRAILDGEKPVDVLPIFLEKHGVPADYPPDLRVSMQETDRTSFRNPPNEFLFEIVLAAKTAAVASKVLDLCKRRMWDEISVLGSQEDNAEAQFEPLRKRGIRFEKTGPFIGVDQWPKPHQWPSVARDWLLHVVEFYTPGVSLKVIMDTHRRTELYATPFGLMSAMWLSFMADVYKLEIPEPRTRTCRDEEHYGPGNYGCGAVFEIEGPKDRQKYCPACRPYIGAKKQKAYYDRPKKYYNS